MIPVSIQPSSLVLFCLRATDGRVLKPGDLKTVFKGTKGNVLVTVSRFIATHGPDISSLAAATESVALDIRQALIEAQNEVDDEILDDEEDE